MAVHSTLLIHPYDNSKIYGEERHFLKDFRCRLLQLEYNKIMLCISHDLNTIPKNITKFEETTYKIEDIISNIFLLNFFKNII